MLNNRAKNGVITVLFDDKTRKMEMVRIRPRLSLHAGMDASAMRGEEVVLKVGKR